MARYSIRRDGALEPGADGIEALADRAARAAATIDGLEWIRSYWDQSTGQLLCLYEAADAGQVRAHAAAAHLPCDEIREVIEVDPSEYGDSVTDDEADVAAHLFSIRRESEPLTREQVDGGAIASIACTALFAGLSWIRSYWDGPGGQFLCLYRAARESDIRIHAERAGMPCDEVREVVEVNPRAYAHA
jgi:hypothetical protein